MNAMKLILLFTVGLLALAGCNNNKTHESPNQNISVVDSFTGQLIADTVIYDVIIHNTNPDDQWAQQCLQYVNQKMLIDSLFNLVYSGEIIAYDFFEKKPLSIREVKKLESVEGFSRDNIGKIQFTERWFFDSSTLNFQKQVISIVLGYDLFDPDGNLRGHKPVFKLNLNH